MSEHVYAFEVVVGLGFLVGFLYDFLRLIRRFIKHSSLACNIEDGIYWILALIGVFYFMLSRFYGEVRFFSIMGFFIGMVLYFSTVSWFVLKILSGIWMFVEKVIKTAIKIILYPLKVLINIFKIPIVFLLSYYRKCRAKTKKVLHKSSRYAKIKSRQFKRDLSIIVKRV